MSIPKQDQICGILSEGRVRWFSKWFTDTDGHKGQPSSYINVTIDEVWNYVQQNGFDESLVSFRPLEARFLIEENAGKWWTSFHERGQRHGLREFSSKSEAGRDVVGRLIDDAKRLLDGQFGAR